MPKQIKPKRQRRNASSAAEPRQYVMEDQTGFLMRVAMQRHTSIFMSLMVHGLTQTQFAALAKLVEVGTCSQNHLGRLIYLDAATIKGVVDRLVIRGLVTIQIDPKDRRRSMVEVTRRGHRVAGEAIKVAHRITQKTLAPLKSQAQRQIVQLLKKMI
jgi:DNA-binding MarR family transcriptional regulator